MGPAGSAGPPGPPGPAGPPGASDPGGGIIGAMQYNCLPGMTVPLGSLVTLTNPNVGGQLTSIVLQQGLYLLNFVYYGLSTNTAGWSDVNGSGLVDVELYVNGQPSTAPWVLSGSGMPNIQAFESSQLPWSLNGGLLQVTQPNTTLSLYNAASGAVQTGSCYLSVIQLQ